MLSILGRGAIAGMIALLMSAIPASAQVTVTPDASSSGTLTPSTSGLSANFTVNAYGYVYPDCWGTGGITCSVSSEIYVWGPTTVSVSFNTGSYSGTGFLYLEVSQPDPPECDPEFMTCSEYVDVGSRIYTINSAPTASFTKSTSHPNEGQSVSFNGSGSSDPGGSISSYSWNFGDGATASGATVSHSYTAGSSDVTRTVTLTVTDNLGATHSTSQNLTVNNNPTASFTKSASHPNEGQSVSFNASGSSDNGGSIASYSWNFGDGATASGATPSHSYTAGSSDVTRTVTLTVTDNDGGTHSTSQSITVNNNPTASFTKSTSQPNEGQSVSFNGSGSSDSGGSIASYSWNFGDGATASGATPSHSYTAGSSDVTRTVTLTVTDNDGATHSTSQNLTVNNNPTASFTKSTTHPNEGQSVSFNGSGSSDPGGSIASYSWNFGDGATGSGATPSHSYTAGSNDVTRTVTLTVTDNDGATHSTSQNLTVNNNPTASFSFSPTSPGENDPVAFDGSGSSDNGGSIASYSWNFGDGGNGSGATPSHTYSSPGVKTVTLTVTDNDGATASYSSNVGVDANTAPVASFTKSTTHPNEGQSVSFNGSGSSDNDGSITSYSWTFGDGGTASGATASHSYTAGSTDVTRTVTLTVTDNDGATHSTSQSLTVNNDPTASFTKSSGHPDENEVVTFNGSGSSDSNGGTLSYSWTFGDGANATGVSPTHAYATQGQYTIALTVTDNDGATDQTQQTFWVNDPPTASLSASSTEARVGESVTFTASSSDSDGQVDTLIWNFGDGATGGGSPASHTFSAAGQFTVTLTAVDNDGASATDTETIVVVNALTVSVDDANPGIELLQSQCVNISVGAASVVCDNLQYVYAFPSLLVMNRPRQLALVYNGGSADPGAIIGANLAIPSGSEPESLQIDLDVGGETASTTFDSTSYIDGETSRFALRVDSLPGSALELLDYSLTVRPTYWGVATGDTTITGKIVSPPDGRVFGRGWWLASYERIAPQQDSTRLVWMGGDHSYRVYRQTLQDASIYVAEATRVRPDTIVVEGDSIWVRRLTGGGRVVFDVAGYHKRTEDRSGNTTRFVHSNSFTDGVNRPTQVWFSTPSQEVQGYQLDYDANGLLDAVRVHSGSGYIWNVFQVSDVATSFGGVRQSIQTPNNLTTAFNQPTSSGVLQHVVSPAGDTLYASYDAGVVSKVRVRAGASADSLVYDLTPSSAVGTALTSNLVPVALEDWATIVDAPPVDPDSSAISHFYTTAWGSVRGAKDAYGNETWMEFNDPNFSGLPTKVTRPNGWVTTAAYNSNGLLSAAVDSSTDATTTYAWNSTWSRPTQVTSPEGIITQYSYDQNTGDLDWQRVANDTVSFEYDSYGRVTLLISPEGDSTSFVYDSILGNLSAEVRPEGAWTQYVRDNRGNPTRVATPTGLSPDSLFVETTYDYLGRVTETLQTTTAYADSMWLRTTTTYDASRGLKTKVEAWGGLKPNDPDSTTTGVSEWFYDDLGRVVLEKTPARRDSLIYGDAGQVVTRKIGPRNGSTFDGIITMTYDRVGRLRTRTTSQKSYAYTTSAYASGGGFPVYDTAGLTIPSQTDTLVYDGLTGNLIEANNAFAHITRTYYPNGLLQTEQQAIRRYDNPADFTQHVYDLAFEYDLDGRRTKITHPTWLSPGSDETTYAYESATGRLQSVTDPLGYSYSFTYNGNGQPTQLDYPGPGSATLTYDQLGRLTTSPIGEAIEYEPSGRISYIGSSAGYSEPKYDGFGHTTESSLLGWEGYTQENFVRDAFGNALSHRIYPPGETWGEGTEPAGPKYNSQYSATQGGRIMNSQEEWDYVSHPAEPLGWAAGLELYSYDNVGQLTQTTSDKNEWGFWSDQTCAVSPYWCAWKKTARRTDARSYYAADGKLRYHQVNRDSVGWSNAYDTSADVGDPWGAFEEYWYDALGRRILKRSRQEYPICTHAGRCYSSIERFVWDGDQILWELRQDGDGDVKNPSPWQTQKQTGSIGYVYAGGVDAPLGMVRIGTSTQTIVLHRNWQGAYAYATDVSGNYTTCAPNPPSGSCEQLSWPGGAWNLQKADLDPHDLEIWYGSVPMGMKDATGLVYQRNRYYDSNSGQFTQQDPIGIAGGFNLYGYAGGDPVNYSDPFGLDPCEEGGDCRNFWQKLGEALKGWGMRNRLASPSLDGTISEVSEAVGVDPGLMKGVIYEEQTHLVPFEALLENFGVGETVGLGQVTVGLDGVDGFSRKQLLDPETNVRAVGMHLADLSAGELIDPSRPIASIATKYNCGSCTEISAYGTRVEQYVSRYFQGR